MTEQEHVQAEIGKVLHTVFSMGKRGAVDGERYKTVDEAKQALLRLLAREVLEGKVAAIEALDKKRHLHGSLRELIDSELANLDDELRELEGKDG